MYSMLYKVSKRHRESLHGNRLFAFCAARGGAWNLSVKKKNVGMKYHFDHGEILHGFLFLFHKHAAGAPSLVVQMKIFYSIAVTKSHYHVHIAKLCKLHIVLIFLTQPKGSIGTGFCFIGRLSTERTCIKPILQFSSGCHIFLSVVRSRASHTGSSRKMAYSCICA